MSIHQVPDERAQAACRAICERLGIDPAIVERSTFRFEITSEEDTGRVTLTAHLPKDELLTLAGIEVRP